MNWVTNPRSIFLTLEKRQKSKSSTKKLIVSNREIVGQKDVNKVISGFYSDLFRRKSILSVQQCKYFLDALCIPSLTEEDRNICEGLLTPGKVLKALKSMSKSKSPGNDGLTRKFYIQFHNIIENVPSQPLNMSMLRIYLINLLGKDNHQKENQTYYLAI